MFHGHVWYSDIWGNNTREEPEGEVNLIFGLKRDVGGFGTCWTGQWKDRSGGG